MTRRQRDEGFIQAAIFLSPLGWQPQYLSSVIVAATGGHPTGMTCQHPTQWRLVEAVWWPHIKGWPDFASSPPGCPQAPQGQLCILLPTGEAKEETCDLAVLPPSLIPGGMLQTNALWCSAAACSPHSSPFSFPSVLPLTQPFIKSGTTNCTAEQSSR